MEQRGLSCGEHQTTSRFRRAGKTTTVMTKTMTVMTKTTTTMTTIKKTMTGMRTKENRGSLATGSGVLEFHHRRYAAVFCSFLMLD